MGKCVYNGEFIAKMRKLDCTCWVVCRSCGQQETMGLTGEEREEGEEKEEMKR